MKDNIVITIIIATFNSEKTLPLVLDAIKNQSFPKQKVEIIIVDGGSLDATRKIAEKYGCRILDNPRTEPVYAKFLGYIHAKGRYLIYLDHDEIMSNTDSLSMKYKVVKNNQTIRVVLGSGYITPKDVSFINYYINEFGDPFSFFIYRLSKDTRFFITQMKKKYTIVSENREYCVFNLNNVESLPLIELCAIGSMVDSTYMKKEFPETQKNPSLIPHFFYLLQQKTTVIAITKSDGLFHYSSDTFIKYLNKIKWRVKNNVHHVKDMGASGYSGREKYQGRYGSIKKYLFIIYALLVVPPLVDAVLLVITRKNIFYLIHVFLCIYTALLIIYHFILKTVGFHPQLKSYDESKIVMKA